MTSQAGAARAGGVLPTLRGVERITLTVPAVEQAVEFFAAVFGCEPVYTLGPESGVREGRNSAYMRAYANADVRAVVHRTTVLRSPFLNLAVREASCPKRREDWPDFLDVGGWHIAGYVDDIDAAIDYVAGLGVYVLGEGKRATGGPEQGEGAYACHFMTPWGMRFELLTYPNGRAYESGRTDRVWKPSTPDRGAAAAFTPARRAPTLRGIEHLSIAVADLDEAANLFTGLFGAEQFYSLTPSFDPRSSGFGAYANADVRATPSRVRVYRMGYLNLELVECPPYPGQRQEWPGLLDVGGWMPSFYVDDLDAALAHLAGTEIRILGGKLPGTGAEAGDGAAEVRCMAPFGLYFGLISYPNGHYAEAGFPHPLWNPARPAT